MNVYTYAMLQNLLTLCCSASVLIFADGLWKFWGVVMLGMFTTVTSKGNREDEAA